MTSLACLEALLRERHLLKRVIAPCDRASNPNSWKETEVTGADCDSRLVEPGHVFFCKGEHFTPTYLIDALKNGACAWMAEEPLAETLEETLAASVASHNERQPSSDTVGALNVAGFIVNDIRAAMAFVSREAWGHPDKTVRCLGITGTKGKTTTAHYVRAILESGGITCGFIGTHEIFDGVGNYESPNTTPEAPELWRYLAHMKQAGLSACVMEISSQALKHGRTLGLTLWAAAFLNIGNDHVSPLEHPSYEDYLTSKLSIFDLAREAVVNLGTAERSRVLKAVGKKRLVTVAVASPSLPEGLANKADYLARDLVTSSEGTRFWARTPDGEIEVALTMSGTFNVENALVAMALAKTVKISAATAARALAHASVPGRMETISSSNARFTCVVDYAHNDISYRRFFETVESAWSDAYVISVFGVSGGKALDRYVDLPRLASTHSDFVVLTSDDPGEEEPESLLALMEPNLQPNTPHCSIADREAAVEIAFAKALDLYQSGEQVLLCLLGKGRENFLYVKGRNLPMENDAAHAFRLFKEAGLFNKAKDIDKG